MRWTRIVAVGFLGCSTATTSTPAPTCVAPAMETTFGGKSGGSVRALFVGSDGSVTVAGTWDDRTPAVNSPIDDDIILKRFGADGTELATKTFSSGRHDALGGAAFSGDGSVAFVGGSALAPISFGGQSVTGDYAVALDPAGATKWLRPLPNAFPSAVAWAPDGSAWVIGTTHDTQVADLGSGPLPKAATYVAHLGTDGAILGVTAYPGLSSQQRIAAAPDGSVYFGGSFSATLDFAGTVLTTKGAIFVAKLSPASKVVFAKSYDNGYSGTKVTALATTSDSRVRVLAGFGSAIDLGGGTLSAKPTPDFAAVLTLDGNGGFVSATQLPAGAGGFDDGVTVIGSTTYVKQATASLIAFDPEAAKAGATTVLCKPAEKNLSVSVVERDGAGNAIVGGRYDVPGPTSGQLSIVIPYAFIFRAKIP